MVDEANPNADPGTPARANPFSLTRLVVIVGIGVLAVGTLLPMIGAVKRGQGLMIEPLATGWWTYPARVWPRVAFPTEASINAAACLIALALAGHALLRWLAAPKGRPAEGARQPWRWRNTAVLLLLLLASFAATVAAIGAIHQAAWLSAGGDRMYERVKDGTEPEIHAWTACADLEQACKKGKPLRDDVEQWLRQYEGVRDLHETMALVWVPRPDARPGDRNAVEALLVVPRDRTTLAVEGFWRCDCEGAKAMRALKAGELDAARMPGFRPR